MKIDVVVADDGRMTLPLLRDRLQDWARARGHAVRLVAQDPDDMPAAVARALEDSDGVVVGSAAPLAARDLVELIGPSTNRVAVVDLDHHPIPRDEIDAAGIRRIHGRGLDTFRWAAQLLAAHLTWPATRCAYGPAPEQFGELRLPAGPGPHPVVVLVHGGFWHEYWALDLMDDMALDLTTRGYATWNIEYRRGARAVAATLADVASAVDHLRSLPDPLDLRRVALAGHSAGGHLVLWAASRATHDDPAALEPALCLPLAPVTDLRQCAERGLGDGAAWVFMGARPVDAVESYRAADPMARLPVGCPVTIVQGLSDGLDLIDLCRVYAAASARHSTEVTLLELADTNHFHVIDPTSAAWVTIAGVLAAHLTGDAVATTHNATTHNATTDSKERS